MKGRYAEMQSLYREQLRLHPELDYLGQRPGELFQPMPRRAIERHFSLERIAGAFQTAEVAIDTCEVARLLREALVEDSHIQLLLGHTVTAVDRLAGRFRVEGTNANGTWHVEGGQVVNALWENRLKIDKTVGLDQSPGWLHRLKYRVIARLPDQLRNGPSATIVLGPYRRRRRPSGSHRLYFVVSARPSRLDWRACPTGCLEPALPGRACRRRRAFDCGGSARRHGRVVPGIATSTPLQVDAGAIVAYGRTDVDDPKSGLHDRTHVGVTSINGYHSVDPGKLTTAPLFGELAARRILHTQAVAA